LDKDVTNNMPLNAYAWHAQEHERLKSQLQIVVDTIINNLCNCKADKSMYSLLLLCGVLVGIHKYLHHIYVALIFKRFYSASTLLAMPIW